MAIPNMLHVVQQCKADHPKEWASAHTGGPETEDFIKILAARCHAIDSRMGLNGKRGNADDLSDDALNYLCESSESTGRTPEGLPCVVIDVIGSAGSPSAFPTWQVFNTAPDANGAWVKPGPVVAPVPLPPVYPPYPGDAAFDAVGVVLFADYAQAGQPPNPLMGRWFGRVIYDWLVKNEPTLDASIAKHRKSWRAALGLP